ncbi:MAG: hypothetical protein LKF52_05875 [Butyrivibrio sp.]|jgi:hypothetical protein|nr:hypothetical protein [Butyrivibrio sp.]
MKKTDNNRVRKTAVAFMTILTAAALTGMPVYAEEAGAGAGDVAGAGASTGAAGSAAAPGNAAAGKEASTMKAIITSDDAAQYTIKCNGAIAAISVGGLKGYVIISADRTRAGIYVSGEQVFSVNVDAEGTGTTEISSIGVGNIGMNASQVHSMTYDDIAASTSSYAQISSCSGADTLFVGTVATGTPGVMKTSGSTAVKVKETVYQDGNVVKVLTGGPVDYSKALTAYEISCMTPQDAVDHLDRNRVQFVIHHKDYSRAENIYQDVYAYQDASGVIIFYENVQTTKNTKTAASTEKNTWYRLGTDGKYYLTDVYGNITDTSTGYVYDTASNSMIK